MGKYKRPGIGDGDSCPIPPTLPGGCVKFDTFIAFPIEAIAGHAPSVPPSRAPPICAFRSIIIACTWIAKNG